FSIFLFGKRSDNLGSQKIITADCKSDSRQKAIIKTVDTFNPKKFMYGLYQSKISITMKMRASTISVCGRIFNIFFIFTQPPQNINSLRFDAPACMDGSPPGLLWS